MSRARIVATAVAAVERNDPDALSIRRMASELGVAPMSLYRHVRDKEEIVEAVVDVLLERSGLPDPSLDWDAWLRDAALRLRRLLVGHPLALTVFDDHPVVTPAALRRMEAAFAVLDTAGFSPDDAARGYATVQTYTLGFATLEVARAQRQSREGRTARQLERHWRMFFATLETEEYPHLVSHAPNLATFTTEEQFAIGLDHLLAGMAQLRRSPPKMRRTRRVR